MRSEGQVGYTGLRTFGCGDGIGWLVFICSRIYMGAESTLCMRPADVYW
jgi:hypothetical protein